MMSISQFGASERNPSKRLPLKVGNEILSAVGDVVPPIAGIRTRDTECRTPNGVRNINVVPVTPTKVGGQSLPLARSGGNFWALAPWFHAPAQAIWRTEVGCVRDFDAPWDPRGRACPVGPSAHGRDPWAPTPFTPRDGLGFGNVDGRDKPVHRGHK
jgi:hypothetical protein